MNPIEPIDGAAALLPELRRAGIEALVRALGPVGMARYSQHFRLGRGDYTAERDRILGNPTVDELVDELERRRLEHALLAVEPAREFSENKTEGGAAFSPPFHGWLACER